MTENLKKTVENFISFLSENTDKEPTFQTKAEFKFYFMQIQSEMSDLNTKDYQIIVDEMKKPLKNNDKLIKSYNKFYNLFRAEEDKKKYKIVLN